METVRSCLQCGYETYEARETIKRCPQCNGLLATAKQKRIAGWFVIAGGVLALMIFGGTAFTEPNGIGISLGFAFALGVASVLGMIMGGLQLIRRGTINRVYMLAGIGLLIAWSGMTLF